MGSLGSSLRLSQRIWIRYLTLFYLHHDPCTIPRLNDPLRQSPVRLHGDYSLRMEVTKIGIDVGWQWKIKKMFTTVIYLLMDFHFIFEKLSIPYIFIEQLRISLTFQVNNKNIQLYMYI
jgi:hypothetical protein